MTEQDAKSISAFATCSFNDLAETYNSAFNSLKYVNDYSARRAQHNWLLIIDAIGKFRFEDRWPPEGF